MPGRRARGQYQWLVRDLEQTKRKHVFVFGHIPAITFGDKRPALEIQRELSTLFEKHSKSVSNFVCVTVEGDTASVEAIQVPTREVIDRFVVRSRR